MKTLYVLLLQVSILVFPSLSLAGGPDAEINAHVNSVQVGDDFITFAVYGEARLFVLKTQGEEKQTMPEGNAKWVALRFENRFLVIHRPKEPVPGFTGDWDELKNRALSVKDKDVFFQVWGAKTAIEGPVITRIDAEAVTFIVKDKG